MTVTLPARTVLVAAGTQPNTVLAREDAHNFHLDGRYFQACDEKRHAGEAREKRQAGLPAGAAVEARRRPVRQFLRRSAPLVLRQRGQSDGRRQAGLPRGQPRSGESVSGVFRRRCRFRRGTQQRNASNRARGDPTHAYDRGSRGACAAGGEEIPARTILPAAELRNFGAACGWHPPGNGRSGAHRRLGGSRQGVGVHHRAGNGRVVRPVRAAQARRTGDPYGPNRIAHRDQSGRNRCVGRRRPR